MPDVVTCPLHCKLEGCYNPPDGGRGWCKNHYRFWLQKGDPAAAHPNTYIVLLNTYLHPIAHEIQLIPATDDYARVRLPVTFGDRMIAAHVLACTLAHGPKPPDKPLALHSCRNRFCYYAGHLRWGTSADNHDDAAKDGTISYRVKPEDREAVREAYATGTKIMDLARSYDVSHTTIRRILG